MKFGAVPASGNIPFREEFITASLSGTVGQGQNIAFSGPTLVMPFAGTLSVNLWIGTYQNGGGIVAMDVTGNMTPAPNGSWSGQIVDFSSSTEYCQIPYMAIWSNLASGQTVPLALLGRCSIANNPVGIFYMLGQARYVRKS